MLLDVMIGKSPTKEQIMTCHLVIGRGLSPPASRHPQTRQCLATSMSESRLI